MTDAEVTLRARPLLSLGCGTAFFAWAALLLVGFVYPGMSLGDFVLLLGFGFPALLVAVGSHPRVHYLRLTRFYFEYRVAFVHVRFPWDGVGAFKVRKLKFRRFVTFEGLGTHATPTMGLRRGLGPEGREHMLPGTFGESAEALAERMNRWRDHATSAT